MNGESVLSEWLARLQQGRVWRRQAEEFGYKFAFGAGKWLFFGWGGPAF